MPEYIKKLTKKQEKAMAGYAKKWIKIGLKTGKTDWKTFDKYMPICYAKAGIIYPKNIVRVQSPLVGGLAASIAGSILRNKSGAVGGTVGDAVDGTVRGAVNDAVDNAVRGTVGDAVDDAVGGAVGIIKKTGISVYWHPWLGGQFWVGGWYYWGVAFVSFFFDICKLKLTKDIMERAIAYRKVCESVNYIWPNRNFVMVCARPKKINLVNNRLHSLTEKAIEYPDGWGLYAINGIVFEKSLWKKISDGSITPQEVFKIKNMEQRRVAYEFMDKSKMKSLPNFKVLDKGVDDYKNPHKVIEFTVEGFNDPFRYYNCICPSTKREYFLETKQMTCVLAKSKSFGKDELIFDEEF